MLIVKNIMRQDFIRAKIPSLRVAIIGAGPAGFYAAERLLQENQVMFEVDLFDRLPTPYGLVRGGVAPDHQNIKLVEKTFEKIASLPRFRFFGNVELGKHFFLDTLQHYYDQILLAVGCSGDRRLKIPGEDFKGSYSATTLVGWYNSHPDFSCIDFDFSSVKKVAIIGMGNVAIDIARILMQAPEKLLRTDISDRALHALKKSKIQEIYLIGRRGPLQAAFTLKEIQSLAELENIQLTLEEKEIKSDNLSSYLNDNASKNIQFLKSLLDKPLIAKQKNIWLRFLLSPIEILGEKNKIKAIRLEKNSLIENEYGNLQAKGTGDFEILPVDMVFRSIGYYGVSLPGIPFDQIKGIIPNEDGKVINSNGKTIENLYVTGWAKRGPSGVIGTNRNESITVAQVMIEDALKKIKCFTKQKNSKISYQWLQKQISNYVSFDNWLSLNQIELDRGVRKGKIREKFMTIAEMLTCLKKQSEVL